MEGLDPERVQRRGCRAEKKVGFNYRNELAKRNKSHQRWEEESGILSGKLCLSFSVLLLPEYIRCTQYFVDGDVIEHARNPHTAHEFDQEKKYEKHIST